MASPVTPPPMAPVPARRPYRRSIAGPLVLIVIGILFLLGNMGLLSWHSLGLGFAHYWPFLLILWGVVKLIEYYAAQRSGYIAPGIGAGGVVLIVFLVLLGMGASVGEKVGGNINFDDEKGEWGPFLGNTYDFTDTTEQPLTAGSTLHINSTHGDITLSSWDQDKIKVVATKRVPGDDEGKAKKISDSIQPTITTNGSVSTLNSGSNSIRINGPWFSSAAVRTDLEIYVPKKTTLDLNSSHGDIKITGTEGDVRVSSEHGDISLQDVAGNASITSHHGDFTANHVSGDVSLDGRIGDSDLSAVGGNVTLNGDYFGDTSLAQIGKFVRFNSSRTNMEMGALPGELKMDSGDLRVQSASGNFSIRTRSKDIHLENVGGNVEVENSNGEVELHAGSLSLGDVSIHNHHGPVQVYLPPQFAFNLQAQTRGEIQSDFDAIKIESAGDMARANGANGAGGKQIHLDSDGGDIEIRKGVSAAAVPAMPEMPGMPAAPTAPSAPKVKTPKAPKAPEAAHTSTSQ
ncbi:MAG TPA: DUF5668 domain-containing protein [Terriglobales bacterium]|nr:DUF5668 domain-containing protein [Terriglobales bacterium]